LRPVWTVSPKHPAFDPVCYWRGPVWVHLNWLIALGLATVGLDDEASALERRTIALVEESGFSEHYNPLNGRGGAAPPFPRGAAARPASPGRRRWSSTSLTGTGSADRFSHSSREVPEKSALRSAQPPQISVGRQ